MRVRKICMIGDFAVGKTSLVSRYVRSTFSEQYLTTVGVKVDSRMLELSNGEQLKLVLWDIAGDNQLDTVDKTYLAGSAGFLLVSDITRNQTVGSAINLQAQAEQVIGPKPFVMLLNKCDLSDQIEANPDTLQALQGKGWDILESSAKLDQGVEQAFRSLGERL